MRKEAKIYFAMWVQFYEEIWFINLIYRKVNA